MREIVSGVYMLNGIMGTGILSTNIYLIIDRDITVVDTGLFGKTRQIINAVLRLGYTPSDIKRIILTHHHPDHTGSLEKLRDATGADVIAHALDAPYIDGRFRQPRGENMGWRGVILTLFEKLWYTAPVAVTATVDDGDELPGGIKVYHTPGHTPGSICLYMKNKGLVIAGDLLVNSYRLGLPARAFTVDLEGELNSLEKLICLEFDTICFGHGKPLTGNAHASITDFACTVNVQVGKRDH